MTENTLELPFVIQPIGGKMSVSVKFALSSNFLKFRSHVLDPNAYPDDERNARRGGNP
jgi:hypothetical protein